jgi:phosphatidylcholine synthase
MDVMVSDGSKTGIGARAGGMLVHVLTASGVALGLLALLAAHERRWTAMFLWLGVALFVDGIDGPLARRLRVKDTLPNWSGEVLDLVVDYLTYVLIPAYALVLSGLLAPPLSHIAGIAIAVTGALYFADTRMKTDDAYFRGFPAVWNAIVFYLFVFKPGPAICVIVVALFCIMTFVPVLFLHPLRVKRFRVLTIALLVSWTALAAYVLYCDLSPPPAAAWVFLAIGLYFLAAGLFRTKSA